MSGAVLGVDPGTRKAGWAVVAADGTVLEHGISTAEQLAETAGLLARRHGVARIALGKGTNAAAAGDALRLLGTPVYLVDERETTLRARSLYFADHPPRGWRRLVPLGMQVPPCPIDDYAAVLIARRLLADEGERAGLV